MYLLTYKYKKLVQIFLDYGGVSSFAFIINCFYVPLVLFDYQEFAKSNFSLDAS